jgi:hypothetical protein
MSALARRTDPYSSHAAAEQMNRTGAAIEQRSIVLRLIHAHPGLTSLELSRQCDCPLDRYQIARRTTELARAGEIYPGAVRLDTETRRPSVTWWPATH